ncbi:hypothetical protein AaE_015927 [Aphanomyces astaci]|uniref:Reverse transcriptase n=1 Tax=Aphanomyces astaci TaxID=112090 RepID=A0A6A4Z5S4_APHAT|nr:hypothetical protein AaE_015927 [Aphanomyces astaci]
MPTGCLKCGDAAHLYDKCPGASAEDRAKVKYEWALVAKRMQNRKTLKPKAKKLRDSLMTANKKWREEQEKSREAKATEPEKKKLRRMLESPAGESVATINGVLDVPYCPDNGSDVGIISTAMVKTLCKLDETVQAKQLPKAWVGSAVGNLPVIAKTTVELRVTLSTAAGQVKLPEKQLFYVVDDNDELIISKYALMSIGLDMDRLLEQVAVRQTHEDGDDVGDPGEAEDIAFGVSVRGLHANDEQLDVEDMQAAEQLYKMAIISANAADQEETVAFKQLRGIVVDAAAKGVWRTKFRGTDLPANVKVNPLTGMFVEAFGKQLEQDQVIFADNSSSHCSPVNPVMKPEGKKLVKTSDKWTIEELLQYFRLTIDYRIINSQTIPLAGAMPFQFLVLENVRGAKYLGVFDLTKGFWQLPLEKNSQELLSFMLGYRIMTPTRVMQGHCDSALFFQNTMAECFKDLLYKNVLIWIDDILVWANTIDEYVSVLRAVFDVCTKFRLRLNPHKSKLLCSEIKWCGRIIDGDGVRQDPTRIQALCDIPYPTDAGQLQQFICAVNWIRDSLIGFAQTIDPLQKRLTEALVGKKRKKRIATSITIDLTKEERNSFDAVKELMRNAAQLCHPHEDAAMCLFTDASAYGWSIVVTQVHYYGDDIPIHDQQHQLLLDETVQAKQLPKAWVGSAVGNLPVIAKTTVELRVTLSTAAGQVKLPGKQLFYVVDDNDELIISKYALMSIGLDMDRLLEQVAVRQTHEDGDDIGDPGKAEDIAFGKRYAGWGHTPRSSSQEKNRVKSNWSRGNSVEKPKAVEQSSNQAYPLMFGEIDMATPTPLIEKEGYPIARAFDTLKYLLLRPKGFLMYCDHKNLIRVFAPHDELKAHTREKLIRWADMIGQYRYVIQHIDGVHNLWADLMSRWGIPKPTEAKVRRIWWESPPKWRHHSFRRTEHRKYVRALGKWTKKKKKQPKHVYKPPPPKLRPLDDADFVWPDLDAIRHAQVNSTYAKPNDHDDHGLFEAHGRIWIPDDADDLFTRLCIVAHCGSMGHRGHQAMAAHMRKLFYIRELDAKLTAWMKTCLLCPHTRGGRVIQRPQQYAWHATHRNEGLHFDFLFMGEAWRGPKYVLVLKDDLTHYCRLIACDSPTSQVAVEAIMEWSALFGVPEVWISDGGSHFKNSVMKELATRLRAQHNIVLAYCPWRNGTVERVNRDILGLMRIMLRETKLKETEWDYLLPVVQANINQTPVATLDHTSPMECFTGLEPTTALNTIVGKVNVRLSKTGFHTIDWKQKKLRQAVEELRQSLQEVHSTIVDKRRAAENKRMLEKTNQNEMKVTEGDFVLWSRVDENTHYPKLLVTWIGPFRVVKCLPYSCVIEHLITGVQREAHHSRLKFYAESHFQVTEEIIDHVSEQGTTLVVDQIEDARRNPGSNQWELLIRWKGLESLEASWEQLPAMHQEIPSLVQSFADQLPNGAKRVGLVEALERL